MVTEIVEGKKEALERAVEDAPNIEALEVELHGLNEKEIEDFVCRLAEVLSVDGELRELTLSYGPLNRQAIEHLSRMLLLNHNIEVLNLQATRIGSEDAICLVGALLRRDTSLKVLGLPNNNIGDEAVGVIVEALQNQKISQYLNLANNSLSADAVALVARFCAREGEELSVERLGLGDNNLTKDQEKLIEHAYNSGLPASFIVVPTIVQPSVENCLTHP